MKTKRRMLICLIAVLVCSVGAFIVVQSTQAQSAVKAEPATKEKQLAWALQRQEQEKEANQLRYEEQMRLENSILTTVPRTLLASMENTVEEVQEDYEQYEEEQEAIRAQEEAARLAEETDAAKVGEDLAPYDPPISPTEVSSCSPGELRTMGVIYSGGWRYTWYSENVLPGGGLNIPGRWSDGDFVRDGDGYLCVASSDLAWGTVLDTPWGTAKVYDSGCDSGTIDMYVSW